MAERIEVLAKSGCTDTAKVKQVSTLYIRGPRDGMPAILLALTNSNRQRRQPTILVLPFPVTTSGDLCTNHNALHWHSLAL